jgi:tRNA nucleotidyltransferase/poly(A) polymerase
MDIQCSEWELDLFKKIGAAADKLQMPCFLIGGFVRDKLIHRTSKDADIVCVGDGILLAQEVAQLFQPKPNVHFFKISRPIKFNLVMINTCFLFTILLLLQTNLATD